MTISLVAVCLLVCAAIAVVHVCSYYHILPSKLIIHIEGDRDYDARNDRQTPDHFDHSSKHRNEGSDSDRHPENPGARWPDDEQRQHAATTTTRPTRETQTPPAATAARTTPATTALPATAATVGPTGTHQKGTKQVK